ncbi:MAG: hypothetical protein QOE70_2087 [Chthoniobacter sp.]|jgi:uncharacterized membrane protein YdjX (TVP38/TMEM64 family)|nr:hypothetical protein [Chthoniobacter sp.]
MKNWFGKYWKGIVIVLVLVGLSRAASVLPLAEWIKSVSDWVEKLGPLGILVFIVIYAVAAVLFVPGSLLTISAGLVFGLGLGTVVASAGSTIAASLAFLIGRYFARDLIEQKTKENEKFKAIDEAIGKQGWKIIGLLRLSPLIPFSASNYFYGITKVRFWPYVLASWIGMLPGTVLYVYLGAAGKAGLGGGAKTRGPLEWTFLGVGLLATIIVTVVITRIAKNALQKIGAAEQQNGEVGQASRLP